MITESIHRVTRVSVGPVRDHGGGTITREIKITGAGYEDHVYEKTIIVFYADGAERIVHLEGERLD